jgi:hypothetical protein
MSDPYAMLDLSTTNKGQKMANEFYLYDTLNLDVYWTFETFAEAQEVMTGMQRADRKQFPDEIHNYEISDLAPF